jgi:hypothetical protein
VHMFRSSRDAGKLLSDYLSENSSFVLFKWSQNTIYLEEAVKMVLENVSDEQFLGRQEWWWMKRKEKFFS